MKVVLANGCFDPLHYGHVLHLQAARELGDRLVVALTSDEALRREKGPERPYFPWEERAHMLRALRCVSRVVRSETCVDAIRQVRPDVFVKGIDYTNGGIWPSVRAACEELGARIAYTRTEKHSSSEIAGRLRAKAA